MVLQYTGSGYSMLSLTSVMSAGGGGGKNVVRNTSILSSFVAAVPSRVGMYDDVGRESMYFLTCQIVLSFAFSTNSLHIFSFATLT